MDKIEKKLEDWRDQLIDLTLRNKLLNYKPTKHSTVEVVNEYPHHILNMLLEGATFQFDYIPEEESKHEESNSYAGKSQESENESCQKSDSDTQRTLVIESQIEGLEQHNHRLQTEYTESRLKTKLTRIYRNSRSSVREKGVNTLFLALGMLEWYEDRNSEEELLAPLFLVPVTLDREKATDPFEMSPAGEETILNPALRERLYRDFNLEFPKLPESSEEINPTEIYNQIRSEIESFDRWRLTRTIALREFGYRNFLMYKDLKENIDLFKSDSIIQKICREQDDENGNEELYGDLPREVKQADLDKEMSPWEVYQILDSDSSQQKAMLTVREGYNLVIEGPPGTGKSQTITNIIADQLYRGNSVLFVSEKMAALDVVKTRLDEAGLGPFVLELHSDKTSKTKFTQQIGAALDWEPSLENREDKGDDKKLEKLEKTQKRLNRYVKMLHKPIDPLGWSPFKAISRFAEVEEAPFIKSKISNIKKIDQEQYEEIIEKLENLESSLDEIGDPLSHPLRGFGLRDTTPADRREVKGSVENALNSLNNLIQKSNDASEYFGLKNPSTIEEVELIIGAAEKIIESPGAELSLLKSSRWNEISPEVKELLKIGQRYQKSREGIKNRIKRDVLTDDVNLSLLLDKLTEHLDAGPGWWFKPHYWYDYWKLYSRLQGFLMDKYTPSDLQEMVNDFRMAESCREDMEWLKDHEDLGIEMFGDRWKGLESDWSELEQFSKWIAEFRTYAEKGILKDRGFQNAVKPDLEREKAEETLKEMKNAFHRLKEHVGKVIEIGKLDEKLSEVSISDKSNLEILLQRLSDIYENLDRLRKYSRYLSNKESLEGGPASSYVKTVIEKKMPPKYIVPSFKRLFLDEWLSIVVKKIRVLKKFDTSNHERILETFRNLDERSKEIARERVRLGIHEQKKEKLKSERIRGQLHHIQREVKKKRKIMPIRKLLKKSSGVMQRITPCMMMSPQSVAKYLDPEEYSFDLLIFDEASQIPPAHAVGAMVRSEQIVVAGDENQLPPTNFFQVKADKEGGFEEDDLRELEDMESILKEMAVMEVPKVRLKWHYRSQDESLFRFSNRKIYGDDPLITFPHSDRGKQNLGIQFHYLEKGLYKGGGKNPYEARTVANAVKEHIHKNPKLSLGIGTFGMGQQALIQDELERLRRENEEIEWFFQEPPRNENFFVKNLENIQGDERDVIFISVTYGPDENGKVSRNFGALNRDGGWRRLNVIITRARKRLHVFSSMLADDFRREGIKKGAQYLWDFLKYANNKQLPGQSDADHEVENNFERTVKNEIENLGYDVLPQVGESGYRIDLGVRYPEEPGRFICGIECDGASYHSASTARDRDRIRQQVLEDRGWDIHRVWSTDWFLDREHQVDRLKTLIEKSKEQLEQQRKGNSDKTSYSNNDTGNPENYNGDKDSSFDKKNAKKGTGLKDENKTSIEEIPVEQYEVATPNQRGNTDDFYEASLDSIGNVIKDVLSVEGPIQIDILVRRVSEAWGFQQVGTKIQKRVREAIKMMEKEGGIVKEGKFVRPENMEKPPVRSRDVDGISFRADQLPPEEIRQATRRILKHRQPVLPEDLPTEVARLLGFSRTGKNLRSVIEKEIERMREDGELVPKSTGLEFNNKD